MTTTAAPSEFAEFQRAGIFNLSLKERAISIILQTQIAWDSYLRANIITAGECEAINKWDKTYGEQLHELIQKDGLAYLSLLVLLLGKIQKPDVQQYMLSLLDEALDVALQFNPAAVKRLAERKDIVYQSLIKVLDNKQEDLEFLTLKSAKLIAEFCSSWGDMPETIFNIYAKWIVSQLAKFPTLPNNVDVAIQCLLAILRHQPNRLKFVHIPKGLPTLVDILTKRSPNPQVQYQIIFCLWLLTFLPDASSMFQIKYNLVAELVELAKTTMKEKVCRVCLATLRNMLQYAPEVTTLPMVGCKVMKLCDTLIARKWSDDDIKEDIIYLQNELTKIIQKLTTWDEYASELRSGKLEWSPAHTSENFWKQNAQRLNEKEHELLRILARILSLSSDSTVLAVACYDIGQYAKYCPSGKKYLQDLGAKQRIMELMTHENAEVRYNSLLAVQNHMATAWNS